VQGKVDAERMIGIGAPSENVHVVGTVKFDVAERNPAGEAAAQDILRKVGVTDDAVVLLGGSTWPGEEAVLCRLYKKLQEKQKNLFLVIVPRHVERGEEIVQCLSEHDLSFVRRSRLDDMEDGERPDVLFVDTTGELRDFYAAADIIFVGKSLCEHGGQNPIEPAMCGKAVVVGPNMENFPTVMPLFIERDALVQVPDEAGFSAAVERLLDDVAARGMLGERAAAVVADNRGVIDKTVELLGKQ
jgi:3-deoxy-D-manno-octulosonic-acid transferase